MSYGSAEVLGLLCGSTWIYIAPGAGTVVKRQVQKNQPATEMESGDMVTTDLSPNLVERLEITISSLPMDDRTPPGSSIALAGMDSIRTFVEDVANFREGEITYKAKGRAIGSSVSGYYLDQAEFGDSSTGSPDSYAAKLTLRRKVTS
jgi:hypothetical protein